MSKKKLATRPVLYDGKTAGELIAQALCGKYFQSLLDPTKIIKIAERGLDIMGINELGIIISLPLKDNANAYLQLREFRHYIEIPEELVKNYQANPAQLEDIILVHKKSKLGREVTGM